MSDRDWFQRNKGFRINRDGESQDPETPPPAEDDELPCVEWKPVRCEFCESKRKTTSGGRGVLRWHRCLDCGRAYKSIEV